MKNWIAFCVAALFPLTLWAADIQATLQWSQRVEVSAPVSGTVQAVNVREGDIVKKGQVLLSLDSTAYRARVDESRSEIVRLNAEAEEDKRDLEREQELYDRTVAAAAERDQAKLKLVRSQSALAEARARLRQNQKALDDTFLRAPFGAVVLMRRAEPGQSVAAGLQPQMLLTLARSGEMIARMLLPSSQVDNFKTGQALSVNIAAASYAGKIQTLGLEPIKIKVEQLYPVDVIFRSKDIFRAGTTALVKLP